jgi:hypothetical protein
MSRKCDCRSPAEALSRSPICWAAEVGLVATLGLAGVGVAAWLERALMSALSQRYRGGMRMART